MTTRTSTVPVPAGTVAVIEVLETTSTSVAGVVPKLTPVTSAKPPPVMVTVLPP